MARRHFSRAGKTRRRKNRPDKVKIRGGVRRLAGFFAAVAVCPLCLHIKAPPDGPEAFFRALFYFSTACMTSAAISSAVSPSRRERDMTMRRPLSSS